MSFYVYAHCKIETNEIFYIGKGRGKRAFEFNKRSDFWKRTALKYGVKVIFLAKNLKENEAFVLEKENIAKIGLDNLCNFTAGGQGLSGLKFSEEHRAKIGAAHAKKPKTKSSVQKMRAKLIGRKLSDDHKAKLSLAHKGRVKSPEHIAKVANSRRGKPHSEIAKQNIRISKCKIVICIESGIEFYGAYHATEWIKQVNPKASPAAISRACNKLGKIAYGYTWRYK